MSHHSISVHHPTSAMVELKLVYRILRKISTWILAGFYSEVHVEGQDNVPRSGALIMCVSSHLRPTNTNEKSGSASCHHNEIVDIAVLSEFP
jgi:glycerol-3-phosphate O-acyltransferase / dihydroxyacetone phosphate acyltransferase